MLFVVLAFLIPAFAHTDIQDEALEETLQQCERFLSRIERLPTPHEEIVRVLSGKDLRFQGERPPARADEPLSGLERAFFNLGESYPNASVADLRFRIDPGPGRVLTLRTLLGFEVVAQRELDLDHMELGLLDVDKAAEYLQRFGDHPHHDFDMHVLFNIGLRGHVPAEPIGRQRLGFGFRLHERLGRFVAASRLEFFLVRDCSKAGLVESRTLIAAHHPTRCVTPVGILSAQEAPAPRIGR